jgi:hypothetical protein
MKTTTSTIHPLKLTIDGNLAEEVREISRTIGMRPMEVVKSHLRFGLLMTGHSSEAKDYQFEMAADHLGISLETARALRAESACRQLERGGR